MQWFRFYAEFLNDPKIISCSERDQRRLVCVLCVKCTTERMSELSDAEMALAIRVKPSSLAATKKLFVSKGFIDEHWNVLNWDKRQFRSDDVTERVRRYRSLQKRYSNVTVTAPEQSRTDTDTDTDKEKRRGGETPPPPRVSSKGKFTPPTIDEVRALWDARGYVRPDREPAKFLAYYQSQGWRVGKNPMKSWQAAAAGWNSRAIERDGIDCRRPPTPDHQIGTYGREEPPEPTPEEIIDSYRRELARVDLDITDWEGRRADTPNRDAILANLRKRREELAGRLAS